MNDIETRLNEIRNHPDVLNWKRGNEYPDIELPEGYGWSYNLLSGHLIIMDEYYIGKPCCDPRFETYHSM